MKTSGSILVFLITAAILFAIGYLAVTGYQLLSVQWQSLNNDWKAILTVVSVLLVFCSLLVSFSIRSSVRNYGIKGEGKVIVYNDFIQWYSTLKSGSDEAINPEQLKSLANQMLLWGSKQVAKQVKLLYTLSQQTTLDKEQLMLKAEHVYIEIRRDLGLRGTIADNAII